MSTNRVRPDVGFVNPSELPRGPNGNALCRWCGKETPTRRHTFCPEKEGATCVHEFKLRSNPGYVRMCVWQRDKGVCASCGTVCSVTGNTWQADHVVPVVEGGGECGLDGYRTLCTACHKRETAALAKRRAEARRGMKSS